ncbi:hypothetical protein BDD12DRAFT_458873 [Trichophaea hybrida]|nr:hypothetical protein BDD12DRAFT_458873 [Trichophaea hybrida]
MDLDLDGFDDSLSAVLTYRKLVLDNLNTLLRLLNLPFPQHRYTPNYPLTIATFVDPNGSFRAVPYVPVDGYTSVPIMFPELFATFQEHWSSEGMAMWALLKASEKKLGEVMCSGMCGDVVIHPVGRTLKQALDEASRGFDGRALHRDAMPYGCEVMGDTSDEGEEMLEVEEEILVAESGEEILAAESEEEILAAESEEESSDTEGTREDPTEVSETTEKVERSRQQNEVLSAFFKSLLAKGKVRPKQTNSPPLTSEPTPELQSTPPVQEIDTMMPKCSETSGKRKQDGGQQEGIEMSERDNFRPTCGISVIDLWSSSGEEEEEEAVIDLWSSSGEEDEIDEKDSITIAKKRISSTATPDPTSPTPVALKIEYTSNSFNQQEPQEYNAREAVAALSKRIVIDLEEEGSEAEEVRTIYGPLWGIIQDTKENTIRQEAERRNSLNHLTVPVPTEAASTQEPDSRPAYDLPSSPEVYVSVGVGDWYGPHGIARRDRRRRDKSASISNPAEVCQVVVEQSIAYKAEEEEEEGVRDESLQHEIAAKRTQDDSYDDEDALQRPNLQSKHSETPEAAEQLQAIAKERSRLTKLQLQEEMDRVRSWGSKRPYRPRPSNSSSTSSRRGTSLDVVITKMRQGIEEKKKCASEILAEREKASSVNVEPDEEVPPIEDEQRSIGLWIQQCDYEQRYDGSEVDLIETLSEPAAPPVEGLPIDFVQAPIPLTSISRPQDFTQYNGSEDDLTEAPAPPVDFPRAPIPISRPQNFTPVFAVPTAPPSPSTDYGFSIIDTPLSSPSLVIEPVVSLASASSSPRSSGEYNMDVIGTPTSSAAVGKPSPGSEISVMDDPVVPSSDHSVFSAGEGGRKRNDTLGEMSREQLRDEIRNVFGDALLGVVKQIGSALEKSV